MYPEDENFQFYNSQNSSYSGGFGDYSDNPQEEKPKEPKKGLDRRAVALVLSCALLGGAAGVGGAAAYSHFNKAPSVVYQNQHVSADPMAHTEKGKAMTPEQLYAANLDSCVGITVSTTMVNIFGQPTTSAATGSGFVISQDGYILTNFHVIQSAAADESVDIEVAFADGTKYPAKLMGGEPGNDVAVLKIEASGLTPVVLGDSDQIKVGEPVYAIGNPLGELTYTFTDGMVSALDRLISTSREVTLNMLQTNCAINPGNSGGPLFNRYGEVIGINTAKYSSSSSGTSAEGLGFAIPINDVKSIIPELIQHGYVTDKPYMGIQMAPVSEDAQRYGVPAGVLVTFVAEGSAAEKAGIKTKDIIVKMEDTAIDSPSALSAAVSSYRAGDKVKLTVVRPDVGEVELNLVFDEKNQETEAANQQPEQAPQQQVPQRVPQQGPSSDSFFPWIFGGFF